MENVRAGTVLYTSSKLHPKTKAELAKDPDDRDLFFPVSFKGTGTKAGTFTVDADGTDIMLPGDELHQMNDSKLDVLKFRDIGELVHKSTPAVLSFLGKRLVQKEIYTMAEPLLIACNPYTDPGNATDKDITKYRESRDPRRLPPHNFLIARRALETLHGAKKSQTIMVSGESGAGKTESTKLIMRYAAAGTSEGDIQKAIMAANPVLEAFGNAMTVRNNNSSRFGRFMMLDVKASGGFRYGSITNFLLEKSRIISQGEGERSYHIFYQLLKAFPQRSEFGIGNGINGCKGITSSTNDAPGIDDVEEFNIVSKSFKGMMMSDDEINAIWKVLAAVLHMGNCEFGLGDMATLDEPASLQRACELLDIPMDGDEGVAHNVLNKTFQMPKQAPIVKPISPEEARVSLDSLSRSLYEELFTWIVRKLNSNIEPPGGFAEYGQPFLALLDIFGFEVFKNNSLEQLFINITNERLQKKFIDVVFQKEVQLYKEEAINPDILSSITWKDNNAIIECLTGLPGGRGSNMMSVIADGCLGASKSDKAVVSNMNTHLKSNPHYVPSKFAGGTEFLVDHTIGHVEYNADGFVAKNTDILKTELVDLFKHRCANPTIKALYENTEPPKGAMSRDNLINSQFKKQLEKLMVIIDKTETHFVRCVKPNERKAKLTPVWGKMFQQLTALSIIDAIDLSKLGYSYRRPFSDYIEQFKFANLGIAKSTRLDPEKAKEMLKHCKLNSKDWQLGKTMVFMTEGGLRQMNKVAGDAMANWAPAVSVLQALWWKQFHKKKHNHALPLIERLQVQIRLKIQRMTGE